MSISATLNAAQKLQGYKDEKGRLETALNTANRNLRSLEISVKTGKPVDGAKMLETRNWVKKLENRLTLVDSSINVLSKAISKVSDQSKRTTASGKRVRL